MSFWEELKPYFDSFGLVKPRLSDVHSDNGLLFLSEAVVIAARMGELTQEIKEHYTDAVESCFKEPGLLMRSPENPSQEQVDDYVGTVAGSYVTEAAIARSILSYGLRHFGTFNNLSPGRFTGEAFIWRQLQILAHNLWATGRRPLLPLRMAWAIAIATSCKNVPIQNTDARILSWLLVTTGPEDKGFLCNKAAKAWKERLLKDYWPIDGRAGMQRVFDIYFGQEHPIARYAPEV